MKTSEAVVLAVFFLISLGITVLIGSHAQKSDYPFPVLYFSLFWVLMFYSPFLNRLTDRVGSTYSLKGAGVAFLAVLYLAAGSYAGFFWVWMEKWPRPGFEHMQIGDTVFIAVAIVGVILPFICKFIIDSWVSLDRHIQQH